VDRADRSAAIIRKAARIACTMASRPANVNDFCLDAILARDSLFEDELTTDKKDSLPQRSVFRLLG
jgi:hypothetical protein